MLALGFPIYTTHPVHACNDKTGYRVGARVMVRLGLVVRVGRCMVLDVWYK